MSRVILPRKAKTKNEPFFPQPVVIGKAVYPHVKRVAKKPKLSAKPKDDHDPEPVYVNNDDPRDLDFAPKRTGTHNAATGTARNPKKRAISAIQSSSAVKALIPARNPKKRAISAIQSPSAVKALVPARNLKKRAISAIQSPSAVKALIPDSLRHPPTIALTEPYGQPPIWAEERQNLCEALPYYRAYQSGAYTLGNLAYGFLLDKDSSGARSYIDEEIVITRAGGGCKTDASGNMQHNQSQSGEATQITSFKNCIEQMHPVALILGSANQDCGIVVPHRYSVMDWFKVTEVWAEKFNGKVCYKFRFEKIELEKKSWWAPKGSSPPPPTRIFDAQAPLAACFSCRCISKNIFRDGWMCLNENCLAFFTLNGRTPPNPSYSVEFLKERSQWPNAIKLSSLKPEPLLVDPGNASFNYSRASWKGMVCPQCGRCNSRVHWAKWECPTEGCGFSHDIQLTPLSHTSVLSSHGLQGTGHAVPQDKHTDPIILREPAFLGDWRIHIFEVMADTQAGALVTHFHANILVNQESGGANDMFRALQEADLGLQRNVLKNSRVRGELLTKHFTSNYGMPYNYVVAVDNKPFKGAPQVIMDGLNRLTWAGKYTVGETTFLQFNELLALGYFEEQSIGYHDDGEIDLGPTIATLSLGGEADMTIRMKEKYYSAKRIRFNPYNPNIPVIKGCQLYEERLELNALHKSGCRDKVLRVQEAKLQKKAQKIGRNCAPVILNLKLHHGDMAVMHGGEMQKYFEHAVTPLGKLRYALTARYVDPAKIDASERWKGEFFIDPATAYNGVVRSLDLVPGDLPLQVQDITMKESPVESNTSLSSQVTLAPEDATLDPIMTSNHFEDCFHEYATSSNSPGLYNPQLQDV